MTPGCWRAPGGLSLPAGPARRKPRRAAGWSAGRRQSALIPRGQALGVTYQAPEADRYGYSETYLRGRITGTLGGRAAEEVIYGDVTTGAKTIWNTPAQSPARW